MSSAKEASPTLMQRLLDWVEKVGNFVPHPAIIFLILIGVVVVLSHLLQMLGSGVTFEVLNPATDQLEETTMNARSLLSGDGLRFMWERLVPNFLGFTAMGQLIVAMIGVGVAEEAGLINTMIRKLVKLSPRAVLCYIIVLVGILSSIASNAGYLILVPLAGVTFLSVGRHPIAGLAAGFAAVAGTFSVNLFITPGDAVLVELTNDAARLIDPQASIGITSNLWFSIASTLFLMVVVTQVTERIVEPRLAAHGGYQGGAGAGGEAVTISGEEYRGLKWAGLATLGVLLVVGLIALPASGALRNQETGVLIGDSPFMNGLITLILIVFFAAGVGYGLGAGVFKGTADVIKAIQKTIAGLAGMLFIFFLISQFVAFFNFSNMATILAVNLAETLRAANLGSLPLLIGFILVVSFIDLFITGGIAKWALLAPIFVPVMMRLEIEPEAVLAAYRVGDSVPNIITPLLSMYALIIGFFQKYDPKAGIGTVTAMMLPYVLWMLPLWTVLFLVWHLLGLPWGL